eukprot:TRINITY_DN2691_c0_g1_i4.p1 TRINITY_DN2691_c0_g1~~TRINITY_DN2691_c0_g1_i4.p1  ORF type:complete len:458 (-),score=91.86 TRINITY_DN2691_c0_g1_i4:95-1468(-)
MEQDNEHNDDASSNDEMDEDQLYEQQREIFLQHFLRCVFSERNANTNQELITSLKKQGIFNSDAVEKALLAIPREYFVTEELKAEAYVDHPLRFSKLGFNISAPHMYAMCLDHLDVQLSHKVLDIGSGTGHFTALCQYLAGPTGVVHGLDIHQYIIDFAESNIKKFLSEAGKGITLDNMRFYCRNCFLPDPDENTYDRIHVGACVPESHIQFLYDKLKIGGILVAPYGDKLIKSVKSKDGKIETSTLINVRYSDLLLPSEAEIKDAQRLIEREKAKKISVPCSTLLGDLENLVGNENFSDLAFLVDGQKVFAHKFILQMRSEHFRAMFASGMRESQAEEIEIKECSKEIFLDLLKFIYTDNILLTEKNCVPLLELSNYYKLDRLKAMCEYQLHQDVDVNNVATILGIADQFEALQLKRYCEEFIFSNISEVIKAPGFNELDAELVKSLIQRAVMMSK